MKNKGHDLSGSLQIIKKCLADFPELVHCWRFLTGVVYALEQYYQLCKYQPSTVQISDEREYVAQTDNVLTSILNSQIPSVSWLRGLYYNAALMRLDAAYERFFKSYLEGKYNEKENCSLCRRSQIDGPLLYGKIRKEFGSLFPEMKCEDSNFGKVRRAVNSLKHFVGGADLTEREQPDVMYRALIDLVAFLSDPRVIKELKKFSGKGIIAGRKYKAQQVTHTKPE